MLSFFLKKQKHTPETPPEEIIQGPVDPAAPTNGADDFIFVERKGNNDPAAPTQPSTNMYPPMPPAAFGTGVYPHMPYPPPPSSHGSHSNTVITNQSAVPYVQDVPFVLAPQLCNTYDITQTQVDGILAIMTRQMSVDEKDDYNFALERSIQNECY
ncbi:uncharacterized protein ACRADG_006927 [Cochliomyia hominivorax]